MIAPKVTLLFNVSFPTLVSEAAKEGSVLALRHQHFCLESSVLSNGLKGSGE